VTYAKEVCYPYATQNGPPARTRYLQWSELLLFPDHLLALHIRTMLRGGRQEWVPLRRHGGLGVSGEVSGRPWADLRSARYSKRSPIIGISQLMTTVTSCLRSSRRLALEVRGFVPVALAGHLARYGIDLTLSQLHPLSADNARR